MHFTTLLPFVLLGIFDHASAWLPRDNNLVSTRRSSSSGNQLKSRWLPSSSKIRGVNLGGLFVAEPWMMSDEWSSMGCSGLNSEFDCVLKLGQTAANKAFQKHWDTWITKDDITQIASLGLNTIRIPVGYWIYEDIVYKDSEHFPQGGFEYLERLVGWASDAGLYIIMDLHGAPGAQVAQNSFTGQYTSSPGFYVDYQYERAYKFLEWMATTIHQNNNFRNVGALEVVNEPVATWTNSGDASSLISNYYPTAWSRIRAAESKLSISANNQLHIQMMDQKWGSGNPNQNLKDLWFAMYDDHRYLKWDTSVTATRASYLAASCKDDLSGNSPVVVGEWSLSVPDDVQWGGEFDLSKSDAAAWYQKWWAAQTIAYEKQSGWIFWSWKTNYIGGKNDWRWNYQAAVAAGVIPKDAGSASKINPC